MIVPPWMAAGRALIGLSEIKGPQHNSLILRMWDSIGASWFRDDETPWCAGFVGHCLESAGIRSTRSAAARSYEKWGDDYLCHSRTSIPYGAIVVLSRPGAPGSGHVGFYCGPSGAGFALLGGNQNDAVNVASFLWSRIVAVRWPSEYPMPASPYEYPSLGSTVASHTEA